MGLGCTGREDIDLGRRSVLWELPTSSVQNLWLDRALGAIASSGPWDQAKVCFFFSCSLGLEGQILLTRESLGCSVGPPHGLVHAARCAQGRGRVAVTAVGFHAISLAQAGVHEIAC